MIGLFVPLRALASLALDLVFPPRCEHCGRVDFRWCPTCTADLRAHPITLVSRDVAPLEATAATGWHEGVLQAAVHALKYGNQPQLGQQLGLRLAEGLQTLGWHITLIIPVPLHATRRAKRGYNQSEVLGEVVAQRTSLPLIGDALLRERDTRSQVGLNRAERMQNVADAFRPTPAVTNQHILIIDDVCTTGSTLAACASAAVAGGAASVRALTVAAAHD
jgi:ComF family protein